METQSNAFLGTEKVSRLMRKFALPCVISLLVGALYNIVDQIYIANASYLGSYGNAANTVVFPLTVIALAIATMLGDGCCAFVSLSLGAQNQQDAHKGVGTAIVALIASSLVLTAIYLIFLEPIVTMFGARVNGQGGVIHRAVHAARDRVRRGASAAAAAVLGAGSHHLLHAAFGYHHGRRGAVCDYLAVQAFQGSRRAKRLKYQRNTIKYSDSD